MERTCRGRGLRPCAQCLAASVESQAPLRHTHPPALSTPDSLRLQDQLRSALGDE